MSHLPSVFLEFSFLCEQDIFAIIIQVDFWLFLFIWVGKVNVSAKNNAKGKNNIMALALINDLEDKEEISGKVQNGINGKQIVFLKKPFYMEQKTFHAFIVYRVRMLWSQVAFMNTNGFAFIESFPDRESAEKWIVEKGKRNVNYTVLEVFRKKKVS